MGSWPQSRFRKSGWKLLYEERLISLNYLICWKSGQEMVNKKEARIKKMQTFLKLTRRWIRKMRTFPDKLNQTKINYLLGYAYNQTTHNVTGLLESLERHKVTDLKEKQAIMKLSDYGRKGTQIWRLFSNTTWGKIGAPGKYIIAALTNKQK